MIRVSRMIRPNLPTRIDTSMYNFLVSIINVRDKTHIKHEPLSTEGPTSQKLDENRRTEIQHRSKVTHFSPATFHLSGN